MTTPFSDVYTYFNDNLSETDAEKVEILTRKKFLRSALIKFKAEVRNITIDNDNAEIKEDLDEVELSIMGKYMYHFYLKHDLARNNRLNISSEIFKITGAQDKVKTINGMIRDNLLEINNLLASLLY